MPSIPDALVRWRPILTFLLMAAVLASIPRRASAQNADPALDDYNLAVGLYKQNRWSLAADTFRKFLKEHPKHPREPYARLYLGLTLVNLQEFREARDVLRKFVKDHPRNQNVGHARYRIAEASYLLDDLPAARAELEAFLKDYPNDPLAERALPYLADTQLRLNDPTAAAVNFKQALERFPHGVLTEDAKFGLARADEALKKDAEAIKLYQELAANQSGARAAEAQFKLGSHYFQNGKYSDAVAAFTALETRFPESSLVPAARLNAGYAYHQAGDYNRAAAQFELAAKEPSQQALALFWESLCQKAVGDAAKAVETLATAAKAAGDQPIAENIRYHQADSERKLGHLDAAKELFLDVARRWPRGELADDALYAAADVALDIAQNGTGADRFGEAERLLERLTREHPQSGLRMHALLLSGRVALAHETEEGYRNAAAQFERAVKDSTLPRTRRQARYFLALTRQLQGDHARALEIIAPLAEEVRGDGAKSTIGEALVLQADSLLATQKFSEAAQAAADYLRLFPTGSQAERALIVQARAAAQQGDKDTARTAFTRLQKDFPRSRAVESTAYQLAEAYFYKQKDWSEAARYYQIVADAPAGSTYQLAALSGLAWSQFEQQHFDKAAGNFAKVVELARRDVEPSQSPDRTRARLERDAAYMRGRALEDAGQLEQAVDEYAAAFQHYAPETPATAGFEQDDVLVLPYRAGLQWARALRTMQKIKEADVAYESLLRKYPKPTQLDKLLDEWALLNYEAENYARADEIFQRLVNEVPNSSLADDARLSLAESELVAGHVDAARQAFQRLLSNDQTSPEVRERALYQLIAVAVEQQQWSDVSRLTDELRNRFPEGRYAAYAAFYKAEALLRQAKPSAEDLTTARKLLLALKAEQDTPAVAKAEWFPLVWVSLAEIAFRQKQYDEVAAAVEELRQRDPQSPYLHQAEEILGRGLKQQAKFAEARKVLERVIADPHAFRTETAAKAQFLIAETYFLQEQWQPAFLAYQKVYTSYDFPEWQAAALLQSGKCDEKLGHWKEAALSYDKLLSEFPKSSLADEARQRLQFARQRAG